MPAQYPDATGYLLALRDDVGEAWFHALCDYAIASTGAPPQQDQLEHLWSLFHGSARYAPTAATVAPSAANPTVVQAPIFLESLGGFTSFKKLVPGLTLQLEKQLTIVFGRNASGKSSLCHALKVLAAPERPREPMHNVRVNFPGTPSFSYQFRGATAGTWTEAAGFGAHAPHLKYFDSTVAIAHVEGSLEPGAAVELSAFRLEVFDYARAFVTAFQKMATERVTAATERLQADIDAAKQRLANTVDINAAPFGQWTATNASNFRAHLNHLPAFDNPRMARLAECERLLVKYSAASSEEGLKSLRAQHALLNQLASQLESLLTDCNAAPLTDLQAAESDAANKRSASVELARRVFPTGADHERHQVLITAAAEAYDLSVYRAGEHVCPLCNQPMAVEARQLFAAYHEYLISTLQTELAAVNQKLGDGRAILARIRGFDVDDHAACADFLPEGQFEEIAVSVRVVVGAIPQDDQPLAQGNAAQYARSTELAGHIATIRAAQHTLDQAITAGTQNRQTLVEQIRAVQAEVTTLRALQALAAEKESLSALCSRSDQLTPEWQRVTGYDFPARLRAMTIKGKQAHGDLVLSTFEQRLSSEYQSLCGATLQQMGVQLASRGEHQDIIVTPHVGQQPVHRVLSEGEQKVHALAVFMCEAVTTPHRVLVFDDPATSFDYNHVSNFCERLRDLICDQPQTQVIVLTHNWDFFVNVQTTINRSNLSGRMSIQVLEDCATVREYSEQWDRITDELGPLLAGPGEPNDDEKVRIAGLMRRLIECLTNTLVFNGQRHQYKAKVLPVSQFRDFTKIVPLETAEADKLRDIYANLSPTEHDDVRNYYTSRSRTQFSTWLGEINAIKAAIEQRRP